MHKIAERIQFDCLKKQLSDGDNIVHLSDNMSRCLYVLLQNRDQVVTKEVLLKEVWERNGVIVTETSIRQTLSQLRRALTSVGLEHDVIFTLPRQGYKFSDRALNIQGLNGDNADNYPLKDESDNAVVSNDVLICEPAASSRSWFSLIASLFIVTAIIVISFSYIYFNYYMVVRMDYENKVKTDKYSLYFPKGVDYSKSKMLQLNAVLNKYVSSSVLEIPLRGNVYVNNTIHSENYSLFICNSKDTECESVFISKDLLND
jgi:DNA-binding winged-HTH domains